MDISALSGVSSNTFDSRVTELSQEADSFLAPSPSSPILPSMPEDDDDNEEEGDVAILKILDLEGMQRLARAFGLRTLSLPEFIQVVRDVNPGASEKNIRNLFKRIDREDRNIIAWRDVAETFGAIHSHTSNDTADTITKRLFREDVYMMDTVPNKVCKHTLRISKMLMHPKYPAYYTCSEDGTVRGWNARTLEYMPFDKDRPILHNGGACCTDMAYCSASDSLVVCSVDRLITIYDCSTGKLRKILKTSKSREVDNVPGLSERAFFPEFRMPMFTTEKATFFGRDATELEGTTVMKMINARNNNMLQRMWAKERVLKAENVILLNRSPYVTYSLGYWNDKITNGECLFLGMEHGHIHLYSIPRSFENTSSNLGARHRQPTSVEPIMMTRPHTDTVNSLLVDTENETLYSGSRDSDIHVIHIERGHILRTLSGQNSGNTSEQLSRHCKGVYAMDWNENLRILASVGVERHVILWNPIVPTPLGYLPGHNSRVISAKFCPKQYQIFTYCTDRTVRIWDTRTLRCMQTFREQSTEAELSTGTLLYDYERDRLVTSTRSIFVHTRKAHMESNPVYNGHLQPVLAAFYTHESKRVLSIDGGTVRWWSANTGEALYAWEPSEPVLQVSIDSTGTRIIVTSTRGVFVYRISKGQLLNTFSDIPENTDLHVQHIDVKTPALSVMLWAVAMPKKIVFYKDDYVQRTKEAVRHNETVDLHVWIFKYFEFSERVSCVRVCGTHIMIGTSAGKVLGLALHSLTNTLSKFLFFSPLTTPKPLISFLLGGLHEDVRESVIQTHAAREKRLGHTVESTASSVVYVPKKHSMSLTSKIQTSLVFARGQVEGFCQAHAWGAFVFSCSGGGMIRLWDIGKAREVLCFRGTCDANIAVYSLDVSTDGTKLYTADEFGYIVTYDISRIAPDVYNASTFTAEDIQRTMVFRVSESCITSLACVVLEDKSQYLLLSAMDHSVKFVEADAVTTTFGNLLELNDRSPRRPQLPEYDGCLLMRHYYRVQFILFTVERRQRGLTAQEIIDLATESKTYFSDVPLDQVSTLVLGLLHDMAPEDRQSERLLFYNSLDNTYNIPFDERLSGCSPQQLQSLGLIDGQKMGPTDAMMMSSLPPSPKGVPKLFSPKGASPKNASKKQFAPLDVVAEGTYVAKGTSPKQLQLYSPNSRRETTTSNPLRSLKAAIMKTQPKDGNLSDKKVSLESVPSSELSSPSNKHKSFSKGNGTLIVDEEESAGGTYLTQMFESVPRIMQLKGEVLLNLLQEETNARSVVLQSEIAKWRELMERPLLQQESNGRTTIEKIFTAALMQIRREAVMNAAMIPCITEENQARRVVAGLYQELHAQLAKTSKASFEDAENRHEHRRFVKYLTRDKVQCPSTRSKSSKEEPPRILPIYKSKDQDSNDGKRTSNNTQPSRGLLSQQAPGMAVQQQRNQSTATYVVRRRPKSATYRRKKESNPSRRRSRSVNARSEIKIPVFRSPIPLAPEARRPWCWDSIFQEELARPCANCHQETTRRQKMRRHIAQFQKAAQQLVSDILSEWELPPRAPQRKALWVPREPYMWYANGISAKWTTNPVALRLLGNHSNARKVTSNEIRALNELLAVSMTLPRKICVPMGCSVTMNGMTFFCSPILPFDGTKAQLSPAKEAEWRTLWRHVCAGLKVKTGPDDVEAMIHPETDRCYVINVGRIFPPLVAKSAMSNAHVECLVLRPEVMRGNSSVSLESEAFRVQHGSAGHSIEMEREAGRAAKRVLNNIIPERVAHYLRSKVVDEDLSKGRLVRALQDFGINTALQSLVAYSIYDAMKPTSLPVEGSTTRQVLNGFVLGKSETSRSLLAKTPSVLNVFDDEALDEEETSSVSNVPVDNRVVFSVLVEEMLARSLRDIAFAKMQEAFLSKSPIKPVLAQRLADLAHTGGSTGANRGALFWKRHLIPHMNAKFAHPTEHAPVIGIEDVDSTRLFERACEIIGASHNSLGEVTEIKPCVKGIVLAVSSELDEKVAIDMYTPKRAALFEDTVAILMDEKILSPSLSYHPELLHEYMKLTAVYMRWPEKHAKCVKMAKATSLVTSCFYRSKSMASARALDELGVILCLVNKESEGVDAFRKASSIVDAVAGKESLEAVDALGRLADALVGSEQYATAAQIYRERVERIRKVMTKGIMSYTDLCDKLCDALEAAARAFQLANEIDSNKSWLMIARDLLEESRSKALQNSNCPSTTLLCHLAEVYHGLGDESTALSLYEKALFDVRLRNGMNHPEVANVLDLIGHVYRRDKDFSASLACYQRARRVRVHTYGATHFEVSRSFTHVATVNVEQGLTKKAIDEFQVALRIMEATRGIDHPDAHTVIAYIAGLRVKEGLLDLALEDRCKVLDSCERTHGPSHSLTIDAMYHVGEMFLHQGKFRESLRIFDVCFMMRVDAMGPTHHTVGTALRAMGIAYAAMGTTDKSVAMYQQSVSIYEDFLKQEGLRSKVRRDVTESLCEVLVCLGKVKYAEARSKLDSNNKLRGEGLEMSKDSSNEIVIQRNTRTAEVLLAQGKQHFETASASVLELVKDPFHPTVTEYQRWAGLCHTDLLTIDGIKAAQQQDFVRNKLLSKWITFHPNSREGASDSESRSRAHKWIMAEPDTTDFSLAPRAMTTTFY